MKTKKLQGILVLNKQTVSHLAHPDMKAVRGGMNWDTEVCVLVYSQPKTNCPSMGRICD